MRRPETRLLRLSLASTGGKSSHRGMVQPGPEQIRFDPKTFERVAGFDRNRRLVEDGSCVDIGSRVVDRDPYRRLAGEHFPVTDRPATAVLGNLPFVDVERAEFWNR